MTDWLGDMELLEPWGEQEVLPSVSDAVLKRTLVLRIVPTCATSQRHLSSQRLCVLFCAMGSIISSSRCRWSGKREAGPASQLG